MTTTAHLVADGPYWAVRDTGGRIIIAQESYGVAAAVEWAVNNPSRRQPTEAFEVADAYWARCRCPVAVGGLQVP